MKTAFITGGAKRIGAEIARRLVDEGARIIFVPFCTDSRQGYMRVRYCAQARAIENQIYFIATNQCGVENHGTDTGEINYFGHSMVVDPWGEVLLEANESEGVHIVDIDLEMVATTRAQMTVLRDRRPELY